jgi:ketosteroid isomerase-like protein
MIAATRRDNRRAMSQENVEVVRAYFEAWERGGVDAVAEFWDPQIDWRSAEGALDDVGVMQGVEAMRAYVQDWLDDFDDLRFELEELIDAGEQVVSVQRITGRAKASGVATELRYAVVNTIRDGKLVRGREYWTRAEALTAVGLSE